MKAKSGLPHCLLIQKYAGNILEYTKGMSKEELVNSSLTYDACVLNFINIGEQVKALSETFKERNPKIPYRRIVGLRNIAAHSYEGHGGISIVQCPSRKHSFPISKDIPNSKITES